MSTLKVGALQNLSGRERFLADAWVNFNGTGTVAINASGNVSSITDNGTGDYTVNLTTALADANYAIALVGLSATAANGQNGLTLAGVLGTGATTKTTTAFRIMSSHTGTGALTDNANISAFAIR